MKKIRDMKKVLRLLVVMVCAGMAANGCKGKEEPIDIDAAECIVGVWGVSDKKTPVADEDYNTYYRFNSDGIVELFDIADVAFRYYPGKYSTVDNSVRYHFSQFRQFEIAENTPRYVWHDSRGIFGLGFDIKEATKSMIRYTNSNGEYYLHAVKSIPSFWNEEFSAADVKPTEESIVGQWDFVDVYQLTPAGTRYWSIVEPAKGGMSMLSGGAMGNAQFWVDQLHATLRGKSMIALDKDIWVSYADCRWTVSDKVTLSCSRYQVGTTSDQGEFKPEEEVIPETPVTVEFDVHALSEYYMILSAYEYRISDRAYYAFHRHSEEAGSAPARTSTGMSTGKAAEWVHTEWQKMNNCKNQIP